MGRSLGSRRDPGAVAPVATTRETLLSAVRHNHECECWRGGVRLWIPLLRSFAFQDLRLRVPLGISLSDGRVR